MLTTALIILLFILSLLIYVKLKKLLKKVIKLASSFRKPDADF